MNPIDRTPEWLRHTVATLAYRGGKAARGLEEGAARTKLGESTRTPLEILGHINDLLDWALELCEGRHVWNDSHPESWAAEAARFHRGLAALDARLSSAEPLGCPAERLFQGPIADALTHVGQIALIRRLAGSPVRGENASSDQCPRLAGDLGRSGCWPPAARLRPDRVQHRNYFKAEIEVGRVGPEQAAPVREFD